MLFQNSHLSSNVCVHISNIFSCGWCKLCFTNRKYTTDIFCTFVRHSYIAQQIGENVKLKRFWKISLHKSHRNTTNLVLSLFFYLLTFLPREMESCIILHKHPMLCFNVFIRASILNFFNLFIHYKSIVSTSLRNFKVQRLDFLIILVFQRMSDTLFSQIAIHWISNELQ